MSTLQRKRIRLKVDASKPTNEQIKDVYTNAAPELWRGNDVQFEIGVFFNDALQSVSNLASVTLEVKNDNERTGAPVMTKTVPAGELNDALTSETWDDGTQQHALITFNGTETNINLSNSNEKTFWLAVSVITTDSPGRHITLGATLLKIVEDGTGVAGTPPENLQNYYPKDVCDALYMRKHADGASIRFKDGQHACIYETSTDKWYPLVVNIIDGEPVIGLGEGEILL